MSGENDNISFDSRRDHNIQMDIKNQNNIDNNFTVTPWEVDGNVDYNKLIKKFGTFAITNEIIEKIKKITGEVHPLIKKQIFFFA